LKRALDLGTGRTCSTMHHEPFIFFCDSLFDAICEFRYSNVSRCQVLGCTA
jgi:hypothetical protein